MLTFESQLFVLNNADVVKTRSEAEKNALAEGNRADGGQKGPKVGTNDCWSRGAILERSW